MMMGYSSLFTRVIQQEAYNIERESTWRHFKSEDLYYIFNFVGTLRIYIKSQIILFQFFMFLFLLINFNLYIMMARFRFLFTSGIDILYKRKPTFEKSIPIIWVSCPKIEIANTLQSFIGREQVIYSRSNVNIKKYMLMRAPLCSLPCKLSTYLPWNSPLVFFRREYPILSRSSWNSFLKRLQRRCMQL